MARKAKKMQMGGMAGPMGPMGPTVPMTPRAVPRLRVRSPKAVGMPTVKPIAAPAPLKRGGRSKRGK